MPRRKYLPTSVFYFRDGVKCRAGEHSPSTHSPQKKALPPQSSLPSPITPALPPSPDISTLQFTEPIHRILSPHDYGLFLASPTYSLILSFVFSLCEAAADRKISSVDLTSAHPSIHHILSILDSIEETIKVCPPTDQGSSRFGNPAFRDFIDSITTRTHGWHLDLGLPNDSSIVEVSTYLHHSLGNRARIDYGSGHELNFVIWLLCLNRLSLLSSSTFSALSLLVFPRYIKLLRKLQSTYYLEPAGSHGVWGLDDYHFIPFLFGASQLLHHPYIRPLSIHSEFLLEEEGDEYLYIDMVRFTMASKTVKGLKWTQPMLDDISGAKNWGKVEQGMRKMFVKEVLGKLPVMQHFLFGSLVPAVQGMSIGMVDEGDEEEGGEIAVLENRHKRFHRKDTSGDCCGIKVPSAVAAAQEAMKRGHRDGFRKVPFD